MQKFNVSAKISYDVHAENAAAAKSRVIDLMTVMISEGEVDFDVEPVLQKKDEFEEQQIVRH